MSPRVKGKRSLGCPNAASPLGRSEPPQPGQLSSHPSPGSSLHPGSLQGSGPHIIHSQLKVISLREDLLSSALPPTLCSSPAFISFSAVDTFHMFCWSISLLGCKLSGASLCLEWYLTHSIPLTEQTPAPPLAEPATGSPWSPGPPQPGLPPPGLIHYP